MTTDNFEYLYNNGTIGVNIHENEYITVEFFPEWQDEKSFNSAEFGNLFRLDNILENIGVGYEWTKPHDVKDEEIQDFIVGLKEFLSNYKKELENEN